MRLNRLTENILSLTTIKGLDYLLAFISFPYLVRVLGVEHYGALIFAQGVMQYFLLFTDYGFNLTAPKAIARERCPQQIGLVFSSVFGGKLLLLAISSFVLALGLVTADYLGIADYRLYLILYLSIIGSVLFPVWFFQGVQEMRYITVANVIARFLSVAGIFYWVKSTADFLLAAFFLSIVPLLAAAISYLIILRFHSEVLVMPRFGAVKKMLISSWGIFTSTVAMNLYTASSVVFLGLIADSTAVGYFAGAKKIVDNILQLMSPLTQAIYPYIAQKVAKSRRDALLFLRKILMLLGGGNFIISAILFAFAEEIVNILLGANYQQSIALLRIMAFLPFLIALSQVFGIQTMLNFGLEQEFNRILLGAALIHTVLIVPLTIYLAARGTAIAVLITELLVTAAMYMVLRKNNIDLGRKFCLDELKK